MSSESILFNKYLNFLNKIPCLLVCSVRLPKSSLLLFLALALLAFLAGFAVRLQGFLEVIEDFLVDDAGWHFKLLHMLGVSQ